MSNIVKIKDWKTKQLVKRIIGHFKKDKKTQEQYAKRLIQSIGNRTGDEVLEKALDETEGDK